MKKQGLIYTGGGYGGSRKGLPARDLSPDEVIKYGGEKYLLSTKLYKKPIQNKSISGPAENKKIGMEE
jgi:hypothetical protein